MAKKSKLNLINDDLTWNADRRYKVNSVVQLNGEDYQNITGKNSNPELLIDWQKIYTDIAISDVTGLPTALDDLQLNKEDKANKNIANGYAGLDSSGKIIPTQLPALAITDTFVVGSESAMLSLVAEVGDVAVRTDLNKSFILRVTGASTLANWQELLSPTSVDQTIIDGSTNAVSSNAVFDGLALKSNIGHTHVASQITDLSKASVGLGNVDNTSDLSKPLSTATINALATKFNTPTGLTTNYLPKWNGSLANSQIFDNGGNVGIGTNEPSSKLEVAGSIRSVMVDTYPTIGATNYGSVGFPLLQLRNVKNGVDKGWNIENGRIVNGDLGFYNEGGQRITFKNNGRVLINKTDDDLTNQLQVNGTISASPATTANQVVVKSQLDAVAARPYKVYTALLTQTGTNAPTATVLENTLGGAVVWTRNATGTYYGTLNSAFPIQNKIALFQGGDMWSILPLEIIRVQWLNSNTIQILTQQATDGALVDNSLATTSIEIRVYN